jgi:hypothetical protein
MSAHITSARISFLVVALSAALGLSAAHAQQQSTTGAHPAAVPQTGAGAVPQNIKPSPLQLTDAQRVRVRTVLTTTHSETTLTKKSSPAQKSFKPQVGEKIPGGLHPHGIPKPLITEIPILKQYAYLKFDNEILIIDAMSKKIVDMIPEG